MILNLLGFPAAQFRLISSERVMVLPKVVALSVQLIIPVAGTDRLPQLDVEPVCKGIAEQGGVTFRDPAVPQEKKNCIESERAVRERSPSNGRAFQPTTARIASTKRRWAANRATRSCSPVWKWREMCEPRGLKLPPHARHRPEVHLHHRSRMLSRHRPNRLRGQLPLKSPRNWKLIQR